MSASPPRLLAAVTVFAVHPPRRGGQTRPAGLLANLGYNWRVEHYSQCIQRTDLPLPRRDVVVTERWTEHRMRDPLSPAWQVAAGRLGVAPVGADRLLALLPRRPLRATLGAADAVYVSHPYQVPWVRRATPAGTPLLLDAPNVEAQLYGRGRSRLDRALGRAIARSEARAWALVDAAVASTEADAAAMRAAGIPRVEVVPNAADTEAVRPADAAGRAAARAALGLPQDRVLALFVGSAHPPNLEAVELVEAAAAALDRAGVLAVVVGRCGLGRASRPGMRVVGEVPEVAPWLAAADLGLSPLLHGGGSSLKVPQYLAAGLPVVATEVGVRGLGLAEDTCLLCAPDGLGEAVAALAGDAERRARMAAAARRVAVERFGWAAAGARLAALLDELVLASAGLSAH